MNINEIVNWNIVQLRGTEPGQFGNHIESAGGNAGFHQYSACICANFFHEPDTGKIAYIGNFNDRQYYHGRSKPSFNPEGCTKNWFLIAQRHIENGRYYFQNIIRYDSDAASPTAQTALDATIKAYNLSQEIPLPKTRLAWAVLYFQQKPIYQEFNRVLKWRESWLKNQNTL